MPASEQWQASLPEQRAAWGIAACCIILVFLSSVRPEWFRFQAQAPQQQTVKKIQTKKMPHTPPAIEHHSVDPPVKIHKVQPKPKVSTATVRPKTPTSHPMKMAGGFYVQVGAFQERSRAQKLTEQLKRKGWQAAISIRRSGLYAVWIGPKQTRASANQLLKAIQLKLKSKGFIVHQKSV
ncbi:MAG: SPOR domain-containing protein [Mariprofundus sp.]|nr:SPOR domain-containing protein [Mariprofundus sp.]